MSIVIKKKTQASIPSVSADKVQIFSDISDGKLKYKDEAGAINIVASESVVDGKITTAVSIVDDLMNCFGDGSDGDVVISVDTTLTADKYYNNLTINAGINVTTAGYRIYVKGTLTNNGTIKANGTNGSNSSGTGGGGGGGGAIGGGDGGDGGNGGSGSGGGDGGAGGGGEPIANAVISVNGGAGGDGGDVTTYSKGAGGAGGSPSSTMTMKFVWSDYYSSTITTNISDAKLISKIVKILRNDDNVILGCGNGGGGGGGGGWYGNGVNSGGGGGGGGGGGYICIFANNISVIGTVEAKGGNGGNGANYSGSGMEAGGGGGGGGGAGGLVCLIYKTFSGSFTPTLTGGLKGTKGTGYLSSPDAFDGNAGADGKYVKIALDLINN